MYYVHIKNFESLNSAINPFYCLIVEYIQSSCELCMYLKIYINNFKVFVHLCVCLSVCLSVCL